MKKLTQYLLILLVPFLFILTSCDETNKDPNGPEIIQNSPRLVVNTDDFKSIYEEGEALDISGLVVTFDGNLLSSDDYFLSWDNSKPVESKVDLSLKFGEGQFKEQQGVFFVSYELKSSNAIFVSDAVNFTLVNPKGNTMWIYLTVLFLIIFAISLFFFVRSRSTKKPSTAPKSTFYHMNDYPQVDTPERKEQEEQRKKEEDIKKKLEEEKKDMQSPFITSFKKKTMQEKGLLDEKNRPLQSDEDSKDSSVEIQDENK